jgi:hypothetical protein
LLIKEIYLKRIKYSVFFIWSLGMQEEQIAELIKILTSLMEKMSDREKDGDTTMGPRIEALRRSIADLTKRLDSNQKTQQDDVKLTRELLDLQRTTTRDQRTREDQNKNDKKNDKSSAVLENILQTLKRGSSGSQGSLDLGDGNKKTASGSDGLRESFRKLSGVIGDVIGQFNNFYSRVSSVNGSVESAIGVIGGLSAGLAGAAAWIDQQNMAYRTLMNSAEGTIRSMDDMNRFASLAGMNVTQFAEAMKSGTAGMKIIGGQQFATTLREVRTALDSAGSLGLTNVEMTDALGSYIEQQRSMGLINQIDFKDIGSKLSTMVEADQKMAQMMGLTYEEAKQRRENANADAAFEAHLSTLSPEVAKAQAAIARFAASQLGPMAERGVKDSLITGGGALTGTGATFQTLNSGAMNAFNNAYRELLRDKKEELSAEQIQDLFGKLQKNQRDFDRSGGNIVAVNAVTGTPEFAEQAKYLQILRGTKDARKLGEEPAPTRTEQASGDKRTKEMLRLDWAIQDSSAQIMRSISEVMGRVVDGDMLGKFNSGAHAFADALREFNDGKTNDKIRDMIYGTSATALTALMASSVVVGILSTATGAIVATAGLAVVKMIGGGILDKLPTGGNAPSTPGGNPAGSGRTGIGKGAKIGGLLGLGVLGLDAYSAFSGSKQEADRELAAGTITEQQRNVKVGEQTGQAVGGAVPGIVGGMAAGAAAGIIAGPIGAAIGATIGGIATSALGEYIGLNQWFGEQTGKLGGMVGGLFGGQTQPTAPPSNQPSSPPPAQLPPSPPPQSPVSPPIPSRGFIAPELNNFNYILMADLFGQRMDTSLTKVLQEKIVRVVHSEPFLHPMSVNLTTDTLQQLTDLITGSGGRAQSGAGVSFSPRSTTGTDPETRRTDGREQEDENTLLQREQLKTIKELLDITRAQKTMLDQYQALLNATAQQVEINTRNTHASVQSLVDSR